MPSVSVVIPTYNSAAYVVAAVDSVLQQSFKDFEILVVDDGSKDDTAARLAEFGDKIRYIHQANGGVSAARNHGIHEAGGQWIAFLDADDTWMPQKLERQMEALRRQPEMRCCYSAFQVVDADLHPLYVARSNRRASALEDLLFNGNVVGSICTMLVDRQLARQSGGFDRKLSLCADWDFHVRIARQTDFLYVDEPLVTYRHHANMMSKNVPLLETDSLQVLDNGFRDVPAALRARAKKAYGRNWMVLAGSYFRAARYFDFLRCALRSLWLDPMQVAYLLQFPFRRLRAIHQQS